MDELTFTRTTEARGRNGWFTLDHGDLWGAGEHRYLDLYSKMTGKMAPITLRFTGPADMWTLGWVLLAQANAWASQQADPTP
jgi:hypothetical protein